MDNFSNDHLDKFFEEGAKQQVYQYREDAWAAMDDMLETQSRKRRLLWWFFGSGIVLLATLGAIYFSSTNGTSSSITNTIATTEQTADARISEKENTTINMTNNTVTNTVAIDEKASNTSLEQVAAKRAKITSSVAKNKVINSISTTNNTPNALTNNDVNSTFKSSKKGTLTTDNQLVVPFKTNATTSDPTIQKVITQEEIPLNLETDTSTLTRIPWNGKTTADLIKDHEATTVSTDNKLSKTLYSIGLYAAPEWTALGMIQTPRAGIRVGVRTDAYFAKHFSVGVGVAYSRKFYNSAGSNYHAPMAFFVDGIMPEAVDAKCEVVEIPLEMKYYFKHFQENGFFVGAGVNSYLLRSEWYGFTYDDPNSNSAAEYNGNREHKHLFSIATVTAGYQYRINDRFNMQVSPYFQIPLTGIGFGQVNLKSAGLSVGMNMKLK